jgi:hypothetical protein
MRTVCRGTVRAVFLLGVILTAACASTPEQGAESGGGGAALATDESVVTVDNNHTSFTTITIFLVPESGGVRQSLGVVEAGQTRTFPIALQNGPYRLLAQLTAGDLQSDRFNVTGRSSITWDLNLNRVRVVRR